MTAAPIRKTRLTNNQVRQTRLKFSIVIPCHNEDRYVPNLLTALEKQTFPLAEFEVIIVDNGSTDDTAEVIWKFAENTRLKLRMLHEYRLGVSNARNLGAHNSTGETLVFLDADNLVPPDFLSHLNELMRTTGCIAGTFRSLPDTADLKGYAVFWTLELIKCYLQRPFGKSYVRKDIFNRVNGFDENIVLGENVDFLVRVKKQVRVNSGVFSHVRKPVLCSLRRFAKIGYVRILMPWLLAYLGVKRLRYRTMASIEKR